MTDDASGDNEDYPYIRAWGRMRGSAPDYLAYLLDLARAQNAPADAVEFRHRDGHWITTDEIWAADSRRHLGLDPIPPIAPDLDLVVVEIGNAMRCSRWMTDRNGLREVQRLDMNRLRMTFATGFTGDLHVEITPPRP
ncbi:hypothetical protein ACPXB5_28980 [Micromonospora arida]|uniref:hypothetical protein n=1 Tax=Micromonospora arida TaxID=2203715 RepID=UPI003CF6FFFC